MHLRDSPCVCIFHLVGGTEEDPSGAGSPNTKKRNKPIIHIGIVGFNSRPRRCHSVEATLLVLEGGAGGAEGVDV